jgi:hypothetical protein
MITFIKIIEKNDSVMALFVKPNPKAIFGDENLVASRFLADGVSVKKALAHCKSKEDWSDEIDIVYDEATGYNKIVKV